MPGAALLARPPLIQTEKNVPLVIRFRLNGCWCVLI
jgi:hypothetical protein